MKTLLASLLALSALVTSSVALAEAPSKERSALDRAVRTHHVARPIDTVSRAVPVGCSARLLLTSTTQYVITCDAK